MTDAPAGMPDPPAVGTLDGCPILDLRAIPREQWFGEMLALTKAARRASLRAADLHELHDETMTLWFDLEMHDSRREQAVDAAAQAPPRLERERRSRQVSIRLSTDEHDDLVAAAEELGMRPGQLVRMLVRVGVGRISYERRRMSEVPIDRPAGP